MKSSQFLALARFEQTLSIRHCTSWNKEQQPQKEDDEEKLVLR